MLDPRLRSGFKIPYRAIVINAFRYDTAAAGGIWPPAVLKESSKARGRNRSGNPDRAIAEHFWDPDLFAATDNAQQPSDRLTAKNPLPQ